MSRRNGLIAGLFMIVLVTFYLAYEAKYISAGMGTFSAFLSNYLDKNQKYLFNISIYAIPILYFMKEPFLKPEYRTRLSGRLMDYLSKKIGFSSLLLSLYIFLLYFIAGYFIGYDIALSPAYLLVFIKLFSFIFTCFILYTVIYFRSGKEVFGVLGVFSVNMLFLIFLTNIDFFRFNNLINESLLNMIFIAYMAVVNVCGYLYLYFNIEKKECLK